MTDLALSPSGEESTATEIVPSEPRNTVDAMITASSLEGHDDLHEIDREGRLQVEGDQADAVDLLGARRADVELVGLEHLVEHHPGQEAVERRLERGAHARVVELADVRIGAAPHTVLGVVEDAPHRDLLERTGVGADALEHARAQAAVQHAHAIAE